MQQLKATEVMQALNRALGADWTCSDVLPRERVCRRTYPQEMPHHDNRRGNLERLMYVVRLLKLRYLDMRHFTEPRIDVWVPLTLEVQPETEGQVFEIMILMDPTDITTRLVYADWLQDRERYDEAEAMRQG